MPKAPAPDDVDIDRRRLLTTTVAVAGAVSLLPPSATFGQSAIEIDGGAAGEAFMPAEIGNLFLLEDLENEARTGKLAETDRSALRAVADWTRSFVVKPHKDLGRAGPVCPFVPVALDQKTLWLAAERSAGRSAPDLVQLIEGYKRLLLAIPPVDGEDAVLKSIVVIFPDLPAVQAKDLFGGVLQQIGLPSYAEDGLVIGAFFEGNDGTALYNPSFRPFTSPVPFMLIRRAVISDWKFFLNNEDLLKLWAMRYGDAGALALATELRRLPWNARRD